MRARRQSRPGIRRRSNSTGKSAGDFPARDDGCPWLRMDCHDHVGSEALLEAFTNGARQFPHSSGKWVGVSSAEPGRYVEGCRNKHGRNRARSAHAISLNRDICVTGWGILPVDSPVEYVCHVRRAWLAEELVRLKLADCIRHLSCRARGHHRKGWTLLGIERRASPISCVKWHITLAFLTGENSLRLGSYHRLTGYSGCFA